MKYSFLLILLIASMTSSAQLDDYHKIQLNKGTELIGTIIHKTGKEYWLETYLSDTIRVKRLAVKKVYVLESNHNLNHNLPILMKGFYCSIYVGIGSGSRVMNLKWVNRPSLLSNNAFNILRNPPLIPDPPKLLGVYKVSITLNYQLSRYFGLGIGINTDLLSEKLRGVLSDPNVNIYAQAKFNYPLKKFNNTSFWLRLNAFTHTEIMSGLSFYMPNNQVYDIGLGWYKNYFIFETETYLTFQLGVQF